MSLPEKKRRRTDGHSPLDIPTIAADVRFRRSAFLASLDRHVSPPPGRELQSPCDEAEPGLQGGLGSETKAMAEGAYPVKANTTSGHSSFAEVIPSPFKLTRIRDLPANANVDTVAIQDILGDVMLKEVWLFDFMFDVDWVMQQFDPDIRHLVSVVLVHGSWRREDSNRIHIDEASKRYANVRAVTAHMPEMYGCHHSKCIVLFRHDDLAQIVVHTANMIEQDWRNLTQGVWLSPLLPIEGALRQKTLSDPPVLGTGARFKRDFLLYLRHYGSRTKALVSQIEQVDFTSIRAALIAHVPAKFDGRQTDAKAELWGWPALKRALSDITRRCHSHAADSTQSNTHVVCQISSIASLSDKWIHDTFLPTLATTTDSALGESQKRRERNSTGNLNPNLSIIFPTPAEVRNSLDGYISGASIHCKLQKPSQRKQFDLMKSYLCHWSSNPNSSQSPTTAAKITPRTDTHLSSPFRSEQGFALRGPSAPHIKTFIRFSSSSSASTTNKTTAATSPTADSEIDWALLTSANLSTQAWGTAISAATGEVRISSYELGVLVWPDLFADDEEEEDDNEEATAGCQRRPNRMAKMVPTFGSDTPTPLPSCLSTDAKPNITAAAATAAAVSRDQEDNNNNNNNNIHEPHRIIGLRMPYDLPLRPYGSSDEVWSPAASYQERDRFGLGWNV